MKGNPRVKPSGWIGFLCRGFSIPQNFGKSFMDNERRFYTYAYLREDRTPYYVGKGHGNRAFKKGRREVKPPKDRSRIIFLKKNLTENEAFRHEVYMISVFGRKDTGTGILRNKTDGGDGTAGAVRSEETKRKMSEAKKGERNPMSGRKHSEGTLEKLSVINSGENHPLYGKEVSKETRIKMSESHKGRKFSLEHRQKIGEASRGRKLSQAARDKIGAVHRGKKVSEGARRKMSEFQTGMKWWNNGEVNKRCPDCPGEGWDLGCLQKPHKKFQPPTNSIRFKCLITGHVSTPAGLTSWQKARNIDTSLRERLGVDHESF